MPCVHDSKIHTASCPMNLIISSCRCDLNTYAHYCQVCEYQPLVSFSSLPSKIVEPYCFPHVQFMRHQLVLTSSPAFPFNPLRLELVKQTITAHHIVTSLLLQKCDFHSQVTEMRETDEGFETDITCTMYRSKDMGLLWKGVSTVLSPRGTRRLTMGAVVVDEESSTDSEEESESRQRDIVNTKPFQGEDGEMPSFIP